MSTTENEPIVLVYKDPKTLKKHPMNPKLHTPEQIKELEESIGEWNFIQHVVVDENDVILIGHGRVEAAIKMGLEKVPVQEKKGMNEADKLAMMLSDNHLNQQTPIDIFKEQSIVKELKEAGEDVDKYNLKMELVQPELAEEQQDQQGVIKQVVIVFESADFDLVMKKFDAIRTREPELKDNTAVFDRLLDNYEEAMR